MKSLALAFRKQKFHARRRGIAFELSFDQWLKIWTESGHLHERGRRKDQYVMARVGDAGPYAIGNIKIITAQENKLEQAHSWLGRKHTDDSRRKISASKIGNTNGRGNKGRTYSPETIERMRQAHLARAHQ